MKRDARWIAAALLSLAMGVTAAQAQSIQLGGDDRVIGAALERAGYDAARIVKRDFTIVRTQACKGERKFQVKVSILGKITSVAPLGDCDLRPVQVAFDDRDAERAMQRSGYTDVMVEPSRGPLTAARGCLDGDRVRVVFNRNGREIRRERLGRCTARGPRGLDEGALADIMRQRGYGEVRVTDAELPGYVAQGCRDGARFEVRLDRRGEIRNERRIGDCGARRLDADQLRQAMRDAGFDRIDVVDAGQAPYIMEGCREGERIEATLARDGRIRRERRIGRCAQPVTRESLTAIVEKADVTNYSIERSGNDRWQVLGCREETKVLLTYDAFGKLVSDRDDGQCKVNTALEILRNLESRGATKTQLVVEGCFKDKRYQWTFDRLGYRSGRRAIGDC